MLRLVRDELSADVDDPDPALRLLRDELSADVDDPDPSVRLLRDELSADIDDSDPALRLLRDELSADVDDPDLDASLNASGHSLIRGSRPKSGQVSDYSCGCFQPTSVAWSGRWTSDSEGRRFDSRPFHWPSHLMLLSTDHCVSKEVISSSHYPTQNCFGQYGLDNNAPNVYTLQYVGDTVLSRQESNSHRLR